MEKGQQWEMDLYERAVEVLGEEKVCSHAFIQMGKLRRALAGYVEGNVKEKGGREERLKKIAVYRSSVEIALNLLHVLMGDVSEQEMQGLEELEEMVCACED